MQTHFFRINKKEYCHITDNEIFVFNTTQPNFIPLEHQLSEVWGVISILNYIFFTAILAYSAVSISHYGVHFFLQPINYGALFLLILSLKRIQNGMNASKTPCIKRNKIKRVYFKTPWFSYPQMVIYFIGPEGRILKKTIPVLYKTEAIKVLNEQGLI